MKFKKIVGFGDSWMYGDELLDPVLQQQYSDAHTCWTQNVTYRESHCFLGLLGQRYSLPTENFGIPGGSQQSSIWTLLWWLDHEPNPEQCLVLVGHTDANRTSFLNPRHESYSNDPPWNRHIHSAWAHAGASCIEPEWMDMIKRHMVLTESGELDNLTYHQSVIMFDGVAARYQCPMLQFNIITQGREVRVPTQCLPGFDFVTWLRRHPEEKDLSMPGGHPNEKGHVLIADMLQSEIDRVILSR